jgi:YfiR/HmsC-like
MGIAKRVNILMLAAVILAAASPRCWAGDPPLEYQIKAAFIYNFTQFVTWPKNSFSGDNAPFVLAVVGDDPFSGALETAMQDRTVDGRPITVRHFATTDQIGPCQVLFVPQSQEQALTAIMAKVAKNAVLTIGESDTFLPGGGAIRFYVDGNKMRFEISPVATDTAGLQVSSKLLELARIFKG